MRIWDIDPGYLNRQSLLGEHRELHGMVSILVQGKKGYARHPETLRWALHLDALCMRHYQLAAEMRLRGYQDRTPLPNPPTDFAWPQDFIDPPAEQYRILQRKYLDREGGRIPLPINSQQLWAQHKYSLLARDPARYRELGPLINQNEITFDQLALEFCRALRRRPAEGALRNALQHMWGHISAVPPAPDGSVDTWANQRLLLEIRRRVATAGEAYLWQSTALGELGGWADVEEKDPAG